MALPDPSATGETMVKIALASDDGASVDAVFDDARFFFLFEVGLDHFQPLGRVDVQALLADRPPRDEEDEGRVHAKLKALDGAALMFLLAIADAANSLALRARCYPVMLEDPEPFPVVVARVQAMLGNPPPWLRKRIGTG